VPVSGIGAMELFSDTTGAVLYLQLEKKS